MELAYLGIVVLIALFSIKWGFKVLVYPLIREFLKGGQS